VEANGVRVKFFGEELVYQSSSSPAGLLAGAMGAPGASRRNDDRSSKKVIHKFETNLDGKKTYNGGESYDFEIAIQQDVGGKKPAGGMGAALGALEFMSGRSSSVSWFVQISLDIPNTIDVKKSVQVNIT
ncbi:hypothetical protein KKH30_02465, partial [Candidatus Micrarchaeota archaeon]|nr:hypothetical protein [Candidatus Micrarchaeota archaeon]